MADGFVPKKFAVGDLVADRYVVLAECGAGGGGTVYKVSDLKQTNRVIALKVLSATALLEDPSTIERFKREAEVASSLQHPNIIRVFEFQISQTGLSFIAMEFVEGISLESRISSTNLPKLTIPEITKVLKEIASGLSYAHSAKVIHRDLKPANILLTATGRAKIADFGLCRSDVFDKSLTLTGECVGTPRYMAPEQIKGGIADARSDIYSFGILAYETITGRVPFDGETWFELAEKHIRATPPTLPNHVPDWLNEVVDICLAKEPKERFENGKELFQAIDEQTRLQFGQQLGENWAQNPVLHVLGTFALVAFFLLGAGIYRGVFQIPKQISVTSENNSLFTAANLPRQKKLEPVPADKTPEIEKPENSRIIRHVGGTAREGKDMYACKRVGPPLMTNDPPAGMDCVLVR